MEEICPATANETLNLIYTGPIGKEGETFVPFRSILEAVTQRGRNLFVPISISCWGNKFDDGVSDGKNRSSLPQSHEKWLMVCRAELGNEFLWHRTPRPPTSLSQGVSHSALQLSVLSSIPCHFNPLASVQDSHILVLALFHSDRGSFKLANHVRISRRLKENAGC